MKTKQNYLDELKELIDDPRRGLKESSNTNKTRQSLFALIDEAFEYKEKHALNVLKVELGTAWNAGYSAGTWDGNGLTKENADYMAELTLKKLILIK